MRQSVAANAAHHYVQRLDLGTDPFTEGYRSDYFYSGGQRRQVLEQVLHFSRFSDQVVLLLGGTGSGTSTLLDQLLDQLEPVMDFCTVDAESVADPGRILDALCSQLHFDEVDSAAGFVAALRYNAELDPNHEPVLVAVDQAHFLGVEGLDLLRQLYEQSAGALHLLLVGEYQVEQLARLAEFDSSQLKSLELEPLSEAETGEYVLGLLQSVGYAGELPLSTDQLAVLQEQSAGNIAEINQLVPTLLNDRSRSTGGKLKLAIPVSHAVAIVVLLVAIGASFWYQGDKSSSVESVAVVLPKSGTQEASQPDSQPISQSGQQSIQQSIQQPGSQSGPQPERVSRELKLPVETAAPPRPEHQTGAPQPGYKDAPAQAETASDAGAAPAEVATATSAIERSAPMHAAPEPVPEKAEPRPSPAPATTSEPAPAVAEKPAPAVAEKEVPAKPVAKKPELKKAAPDKVVADKTVPAKPQPKKTGPAAIPPREQRLLDMDSNAFVLQLMGSVEEQRAREMVKEYIGRLPLTYFEASLKGKPWFVVVTGPYKDKNAARSGIGALPQKLQREKPWLRSVSGVQEEIRKYRGLP